MHKLPIQPESGGLTESDKVECRLPIYVESDLIRDFPAEIAREFGVVPLGRIGKQGSLLLAIKEELSPEAFKDLRKRLGYPFHVIQSSPSEIKEAVSHLFDEGPVPTDDASESGPMKDGESEASLPLETAGPQSSPLSLASPEPDLPKEQDSREKDPHEESFTAQEADDEDQAQKLSDLLVELGFLTHRELQQHMNQLGDVEDSHCDLSPFIDTTILRLLPDTMARQHMVLPLKKDSGELALATGHILSKAVLAEIQKATGIEVKPALVDSGELQASIEGCYRRQERLDAQQMRLGEYLLARGLIQKRQLESCLKEQEKSQEKLGELLVRHGYVTEDTVYSYLGKKLGYEYRRFSTSDIDVELSKLVSKKFVERNLILPLALDQDTQQLEVAMAEPYDLKVLDTLKTLVGHRKYELKPILSAPDNIKEGINYSYNFQEVFEDEVDIEWLAEERDDRKDLVATEDIPQIRRIINQVLYRAVVENASDVHIENQQTRVRVRFRLDGLLQERKTSITKDNIRSVCSVFKVDSGLDITESRRSQDGVFKMRIGPERYVDFRINLHATDFGQDAVIRVLDTTKNLLALEAVGFPPKMLDNYLSLVENPQGLILFTGPTGSGKSTTLYSTLAHLNSGDQKIVTAEDPVEYYLDGICQYKVNENIGNTGTYTSNINKAELSSGLVRSTNSTSKSLLLILGGSRREAKRIMTRAGAIGWLGNLARNVLTTELYVSWCAEFLVASWIVRQHLRAWLHASAAVRPKSESWSAPDFRKSCTISQATLAAANSRLSPR